MLCVIHLTGHTQTITLKDQAGSNGRDIAGPISSNSTGVVTAYQYSGTNVFYNGGNTAKTPNACTELAVVKYNHNNTLQWASKIGLQAVPPFCTSKNSFVDAITMSSTGEVFVAGRFEYKDISFSGMAILSKPCNTDRAIFIVKYSATGAVLWSRKYETASGSDRIVEMEVTSSGKLIVSGIFWSPEINWNSNIINRTDRTASFIGSMDTTSGQTSWLKSFNGSVSTQDIAIDASDNIVWLGNCYGYNNDIAGNTVHSQGKMDMVVGIFDESGNYIAMNHLTGAGNDLPTALHIDPSGKIWISGRTNGNTITGTSLANSASIDGHYISFLIGLNSGLSVTNSIQISGDGHDGPMVLDACNMTNGNFCLIGTSDGNSGQFGAMSQTLSGNCFVMITDANGTTQSVSSFDLKNPHLLSVSATPTGVVLFGHAHACTIGSNNYTGSGGNDTCVLNGTSFTGTEGTDVFLISVD